MAGLGFNSSKQPATQAGDPYSRRLSVVPDLIGIRSSQDEGLCPCRTGLFRLLWNRAWPESHVYASILHLVFSLTRS
jgi:hypothetical protein